MLIVLQILLFLYHQVTTLFDLFPLNNVRDYSLKERLEECLVNGLIMAIPPAGLLLNIEWMIKAALVIYPLLLLGAYLSWWRPYLFGPTPQWKEIYDRIYETTIKVLPPIRNHPIPNLEHSISHMLMLLITVVTYLHFFSR
ncbi:hypothetical protein [Aridibaculum aurantiacum]|uniref:hypothetical protein n=1 Tax=Aridibaculum aurantiacum TaxID=2810307 RepID=UPI001A96DEAD|nr:hypothetical protein [Aridibaculum aurantiacum]